MAPRKGRKAGRRPAPRAKGGIRRWLGPALGLGLLLAAAAGVFAAWRPGSAQVEDPQRVPSGPARSPFDGARAFRDLERVVGIGPRSPGTEGSRQVRALIREALEGAGLEVWEHAFTADTPLGPRDMVNVVGVVRGTEPGVLVLSNHYDTKYFPDFRFVGANDAGSTTAWMMEMGRVLGPSREGMTVWLVFFDGEESFVKWSPEDSLYGSRALVRHLEEQGRLQDIKALVNVDMIGDCYLGIKRDRDAPAWLVDAVWRKARELGYGRHFLPVAHTVEDDHLPFREAGIPAMVVIDFTYGPSPADHQLNWHTPRDTLDKVCPESLQAVGDVIYHSLPDIEAQASR